MPTENFSKIEKKLLVLGKISPNKSWKHESRALLMSEFSKPKKEQSNSWRFAFAGLAVIALLISFTSIAAANSLPGEIFYPIKRSYEKIKIAFVRNESELVVQRKLVDKRVDELVKVVEDNQTQSTQAIAEVEHSVDEINHTVELQRTKVEQMEQKGENSAEIKENLASLVPAIEQKQTQLSQIETSLPQESQEKVSSIIGRLEDLKLAITATIEPQVKGVEDLLETPSNQLQP